jgi:hypothetical protein
VTVPRVHLGPHGQRRVATLLATAAVGRGSDGRASHGPVSAGGAAGVLLVEAPTPQLQLLPVHFLLLVAATTIDYFFARNWPTTYLNSWYTSMQENMHTKIPLTDNPNIALRHE